MAEADDFNTELFIFPDGTAVEIIVVDTQRVTAASRAGSCRASASASPQSEAPAADRCAGRELSVVPSPAEPETDAHVCPVCGSSLVYPIDWTRQSEAAWSLTLRCPECQYHGIAKRGPIFRCGKCGHEWGGAIQQRPGGPGPRAMLK